MALPFWPGSVPYTSQTDGFQSERQSPSTETSMEAGNTRIRRREVTPTEEQSLSIVMTVAHLVAFRNFVDVTLLAGSSRFLMLVRQDGGYHLRVVRLRDGVFREAFWAKGLTQVDFTVIVY